MDFKDDNLVLIQDKIKQLKVELEVELSKPKVDLGLRIKAFRNRLGLSQLEVADLITMQRTAYTNIENGRAWPTIKIFCSLCHALETTPNELLEFKVLDDA